MEENMPPVDGEGEQGEQDGQEENADTTDGTADEDVDEELLYGKDWCKGIEDLTSDAC